ncbi:hypothetical protein L218DRAFT_480925 [Marasmius fiardii PR-910]|nr:hypothetical protein L218DRAFT_480925 [Marasmius fiardii PR-910]
MTHSEEGRPTKKSGHSRNPMACTNCRARKIKCESNRQHPERPCQRCTNRKLHCEYVAISHPPPAPAGESYKLEQSASPESPRRSHSRAPSGHLPVSQPRYSPVSSSSSRKSSPRNEYDYLSPEPHSYLLSQGTYAPDPGSTPRYNSSYYPTANYSQTSVFSQNGNNQLSNLAMRTATHAPCYIDPSFGLNPSLAQSQVNFGSGADYLAWNNGVSVPAQSQFYYSSECRCTGMYCTCGNRRP